MLPNSATKSYSGLLTLRAKAELERRKRAAESAKIEPPDVIEWCNRYVRTYDPRLSNPIIPFTLFPRQEEYLRWLADRQQASENGLVEKSRDSGLTWLCCVYAVHQWLFKGAVSIGFGSRKLDLVDKIGNPDSILEKCRIIIRNLPKDQLPKGFNPDKDMGHCRIINPATGATIIGEGGDQIGRGGRQSLYFVDEAAFLEHPQLVEAALSQTTNCRIDVSTPNGSGNAFYSKRFSGKVPVFTFHWKDDPRKGPDWYAKQCAQLDPVIIAQEIDIDYTASIEGIVIPASWVRAAVNLSLPASGPRVGGYDVADEGTNKNVIIGRQGPVVIGVKSWQYMDTTQSAHRSADEAEAMGLSLLNYDPIGVGAGIKGAYNAMERSINFRLIPLNVGESPSDTRWPDNQTSKEKFINVRAEGWWMLRRRFEKTYEHVTNGTPHPPEEMISIPDNPELIAQLSQPLWFRTETGKIKIEAKDQMRRRGIKSPDHADALVMAFYPSIVPKIGVVKW